MLASSLRWVWSGVEPRPAAAEETLAGRTAVVAACLAGHPPPAAATLAGRPASAAACLAGLLAAVGLSGHPQLTVLQRILIVFVPGPTIWATPLEAIQEMEVLLVLRFLGCEVIGCLLPLEFLG